MRLIAPVPRPSPGLEPLMASSSPSSAPPRKSTSTRIRRNRRRFCGSATGFRNLPSDLRRLVAAAFTLLAICSSPTLGQIEVALETATGVRGADLVVPLMSSEADVSWPETLECRVGGRVVRADIGWIVPRALPSVSWTSPVRPVSVARLDRGGPAPEGGSPIALIPIPMDANGEVELLDRRWKPTWWDGSPVFAADRETIGARSPDADPPLDDPMEWYRWAIRADLEGGRPPAPVPGPDADPTLFRRVAIAVAAEWRAGLARVAEASPGIASEIAERLTATVVDTRRPIGRQSVGAWPTDVPSLLVLRKVLLDPNRSPIESARAGLAWFDVRPPFIAWLGRAEGERIELEIANPTAGELVVLATWTESGDASALVVPPRSLVRRELDRPTYGDGPAPTTEGLQLEVDGRSQRMSFGPRAIPVRPPGCGIGPFALARTLAGVDQDFEELLPPSFDTAAVLRRRAGRWEIFIEALTPDPADGDDTVHLLLGPPEAPVVAFEMRGDGTFGVDPPSSPPDLRVDFQGHRDRWRACIVLPESWLVRSITDSREGAILLGLRRDGPRGFISFAGPPPPSWRRDIPIQAFAIGDWQDPEPVDPGDW